ncbi:MAG: exonuclease [Candidatus Brocadiia bacterium]|nr:MAG: exonuclease [Candidatus Brocadiia bacterium]
MKLRAYLDIETTGLSRNFSELTVIGVALETPRTRKVIQFVGSEISDVRLIESLQGIDRLYTYNGSRFDLPFIKSKLGIDLNEQFAHTDLMYNCWDCNLKGGLKIVEQKLAIERKLKEVDGRIAVLLWREYVNNNSRSALNTLLEYNAEDVLNLITLRKKLAVP